MRVIRSGVLAACVAALVGCAAAARGGIDAPTSGYIADRLASTVGELPQLGWVLPDGLVVSRLDAQEVSVLSWDTEPTVASRRATVASVDTLEYAKQHHVDC